MQVSGQRAGTSAGSCRGFGVQFDVRAPHPLTRAGALADYEGVDMAESTTAWTRFMDMHSGGGLKEPPYARIFIEAPEAEAKVVFYNRFGHNPERVSCTCCGDDYSISEGPTLEEATAFDRNCRFGWTGPDGASFFGDPREVLGVDNYRPVREAGYVETYFEEEDAERAARFPTIAQYIPLADYLARPEVLVIRADDITPEMREGSVPAQGYVWAG